MRGTGHGLFARPRMRVHTRRAQTQINGRRSVELGANIVSSHGRKVIPVQPLRWGHLSGHGQVRHPVRTRTDACYRGGGHTWLLKGRARLRGRGV
jgi:hypothetical protein